MIPKISINVKNGNLGGAKTYQDGTAGLVCTANTPTNVGKVYKTYSLSDAENQGITLSLEPYAYRHVKEFYLMTGDGAELWVMLAVNTATMAQISDPTNANGAIKLINASNGTIRLLGITRNPIGGYNGGAEYLDADVASAVSTSKALGQYLQNKLMPARLLIEGRINDDTKVNTYLPNSASNGYAGVVLGAVGVAGNVINDGSASVGLVLGRAAKIDIHINLGKVADGALPIDNVYFKSKKYVDYYSAIDLSFIDVGFITFKQYPNTTGFYISDDPMATANTDDFRLLTNGRVIDKAILIAYVTYLTQINRETFLVNGKIDPALIKYLQSMIELAINNSMGASISKISVYIDENQNVLASNSLIINLGITPLGYLKQININIGFLTN